MHHRSASIFCTLGGGQGCHTACSASGTGGTTVCAIHFAALFGCLETVVSASNPAAPASGILPDWLLQNSSRQGLASGPWKALSWMSRVAGLPALHQALNTAVAKAFLHASSSQPRREALPFSLSFVCWLERRVMSTDCMLRAACSAPSGVRYVGLTPCGWRHPLSTFNWSRAAWSASLPGPKLPRLACTGVHCCLA